MAELVSAERSFRRRSFLCNVSVIIASLNVACVQSDINGQREREIDREIESI